MILFIDTETTGLPNKNLPVIDKSQPNIVQLAFIFSDANGREMASFSGIITPYWQGEVPERAAAVHGITRAIAEQWGIDAQYVIDIFYQYLDLSQCVVAHNLDFDIALIRRAFYVLHGTDLDNQFKVKLLHDTMELTTPICKMPGNYGKYKWPKLIEAYRFLFNEDFEGQHDALADVRACKRIYFELKRRGIIH